MAKDLKNNPLKYWSLQLVAASSLLVVVLMLHTAKTPLFHVLHFLFDFGILAWMVYSAYNLRKYLKAAKKSKEATK
ncbi:hypothetical protein [Eupransor demetentiae]